MMMMMLSNATTCTTTASVKDGRSDGASKGRQGSTRWMVKRLNKTTTTTSGRRMTTRMMASTGVDDTDDTDDIEAKRRYVNFTGFPFPLVPLLSRRTTMQEIVPGSVWTLEQEQGIGFGLGVSTNVRSTVVKLRDGSLWVHDPIAPTEECVELLREIGGEVKYAVLSTTQYEHKIFAPAFTRAFPNCQLWIAPAERVFGVVSQRCLGR